MNTNFDKVQQRAVQYGFIDGLAEIGLAGFCLLLAALFWIQPMLPGTVLRDLVFFLLAFAGSFGIRSIIQRVKDNDTYPRTGYVVNKSGWENKRVAAALIIFTVLLFSVQLYLALQEPQASAWMPLIGGAILAFIFSLMAYRAALPRFYALAIFSLLAGGGLRISGLGDFQSTALLCALLGFILLAFGIRTRRAYIHQNPRPAPQADEQ